jgi:hypothetical protein
MPEIVPVNADQSFANAPLLKPHMARLVLAAAIPLAVAAASLGMVLSQRKAAEDFAHRAKAVRVYQADGKTYMEPVRPFPPDEECVDTKTIVDLQAARVVTVVDPNCLPTTDARLIERLAMK